MVEVITQAGEHAAFFDRLERHQRPVSHDFIAVVELNFAHTLMCGNGRFQLFRIQHVFSFDIRDLLLWQRQPEVLIGSEIYRLFIAGGVTRGIALSLANAQETLEASKDTAIKKRAFNSKSSTITKSPSFLRKFALSYSH
jgi:hypothetical protein